MLAPLGFSYNTLGKSVHLLELFLRHGSDEMVGLVTFKPHS